MWPTMIFIHQIILKILRTMKYRSHRPTFILRSNTWSYWPIIPKYDVHKSNNLQDVMQNHGPWNIGHSYLHFFRSNIGSCWFIIPNKDVHISNNLQDIRPNHWTMKYRSQWHTFILRSNVVSYRFILPNYDVHTSNSLPRYKAKSLDREI